MPRARRGLASWGSNLAVTETLAGSGNLAAAERVFRPMGVPPDPPRPDYSVQNSGLPGARRRRLNSPRVEVSNRRRRLTGSCRISAGTSPCREHGRTRHPWLPSPLDQEYAGSRRREPEAQRSSRGRTRRPAAVEGSAVEPAVEERRTEQPTEMRMPTGAAASGLGKRGGRRRTGSPETPAEVVSPGDQAGGRERRVQGHRRGNQDPQAQIAVRNGEGLVVSAPADMPAQVHLFVQHADNLHQPGLDCTVDEYVNWPLHGGPRVETARVA